MTAEGNDPSPQVIALVADLAAYVSRAEGVIDAAVVATNQSVFEVIEGADWIRMPALLWGALRAAVILARPEQGSHVGLRQ